MKLSLLFSEKRTTSPADVLHIFFDGLKGLGISQNDVSFWQTTHDTIYGHISTQHIFTTPDRGLLNDLLRSKGWMLSTLRKLHPNDAKWYFQLALELTEVVHPRELYHITPSSKRQEIIQQGLVPQGRSHGYTTWKDFAASTFYPPRIYLHTDPNDAVRMACQFRDSHQEKMEVLKIDPSKITGATFRLDPEDPSKKFVWTNVPIPPQAVKHLMTIDQNADEIYQSVDPLQTALAMQKSLP